MEIAIRRLFDQCALLFATSSLEQRAESETLMRLNTTLIEPTEWEDHGGLSSILGAGDRLVVNAPARTHERVVWLLRELQANEEQGARIDPPPGLSTRAHAADDPAAAVTPAGSYTIRVGDTLHSIAESELGDAERVEAIREANPGLDPAGLPVGGTLILPTARRDLRPGERVEEPRRARQAAPL